MLEELLAAGHSGAEYDAWLIRIGEGDQFGSGFVGVNPNSKIPALMDYSEQTPRRVFESGAILLYLADKFGAFLPKDRGKRTEALNWLFWQMGSTPYVGGGFGHFYAYAPVKIKYAIDRFTMELKRQLDVLDRQLADNHFIAGDEYTIADMAIWPWYGNGMLNGASYNDPRKFLQTHEYKNLTRWTKEIGERPAVKRGRMVNRVSGPLEEQLRERGDTYEMFDLDDIALVQRGRTRLFHKGEEINPKGRVYAPTPFSVCPARERKLATTGADGRARFDGLAAESLVSIELRKAPWMWKEFDREVRLPVAGSPEHPDRDLHRSASGSSGSLRFAVKPRNCATASKGMETVWVIFAGRSTRKAKGNTLAEGRWDIPDCGRVPGNLARVAGVTSPLPR